MSGKGRKKHTQGVKELIEYAKKTAPLRAHFYQKFNYIDFRSDQELLLNSFNQYFKEPKQQEQFTQLLNDYSQPPQNSDKKDFLTFGQLEVLTFGQFSDRDLIIIKRKKNQENNYQISLKEYIQIYLFEIAKMSSKNFVEFCKIFQNLEGILESRSGSLQISDFKEKMEDVLRKNNQENSDIAKGCELLYDLMLSTYEYFKKEQAFILTTN